MTAARLAHALAPALLHIHLHLHHHFHGPPIDYAGLAAAAGASFFGIPGPGEPLLVTAGILAAHHKLDIAEVVMVAWAGAAAGGVIGWLLGMAGGRTVLTTRGPFLAARLRTLRRGDQLFERHPVLGVVLAPSWIAGIHRMSAPRFLVLNAATALVWAAGIGIGAFYAGPAVVEWVDDLGLFLGIALGVLLAAAVGTAWLRRRKRRSRV